MIWSEKQCNSGNMSAFAILLAVRALPGQLASTQQLGAVYRHTVWLARQAYIDGHPLKDPQQEMEAFASTGAELCDRPERQRASAWASARAHRLERKKLLSSVSKSVTLRNRYGDYEALRLFYSMTRRGEQMLQALERNFELAYWMHNDKIEGLTLVNRVKI